MSTRVALLTLAMLLGVAHAEEPASSVLVAPEEFSARVLAGTLEPERFDFAAAGFWDLRKDERILWYARVSQALGLQGGSTSATCDARLREIRWFDIPTHGAAADDAAWHLVQHADREPEFQRAMLEQLRSMPPAATSQKNLAYLWDRLARAAGPLQRYATQGFCTPDGSWKPHPVEDPDHVDERRVAAAMKPIASAIETNREACLQPPPK